ncbi:sortase [bacterium]|nr:sortase [bacterium]
MHRVALRTLAYTVMAAGLILLARASEVPLKALAGQFLLRDVWKQTLTSGNELKPWASADFKVTGELTIPRLGLSQIVLDRASGEAMSWSIGAVYSDPNTTNAIILDGHRDTHMKFMAKLRIGDLVNFQASDASIQTYKIIKSRVLETPQLNVEDRFEESTQIILTTCWPFNGTQQGPERYVLVGQEV